MDRNDNRPMPTFPEYRFEVAEGTPAGTIVSTIQASDVDSTNRRLYFEIVSGDPNGHFVINTRTGMSLLV